MIRLNTPQQQRAHRALDALRDLLAIAEAAFEGDDVSAPTVRAARRAHKQLRRLLRDRVAHPPTPTARNTDGT
jgi:hypothetical protein